MKHATLLSILLSTISLPALSNNKTDEFATITTNDSHEYIFADHQVLTFPRNMMTLTIDYNKSPGAPLSKISVSCMGKRRSLSFDHTYFAGHVLPLMDSRHDASGRLEWVSFSMDMRTARSLKDPDRVFGILCTKDKIEFSILGQAVVP
jgi:hypothetical protein